MCQTHSWLRTLFLFFFLEFTKPAFSTFPEKKLPDGSMTLFSCKNIFPQKMESALHKLGFLTHDNEQKMLTKTEDFVSPKCCALGPHLTRFLLIPRKALDSCLHPGGDDVIRILENCGKKRESSLLFLEDRGGKNYCSDHQSPTECFQRQQQQLPRSPLRAENGMGKKGGFMVVDIP